MCGETQVRGECKTPGGKLVGVNVTCDADGAPVRCTIDGDFFIEGGDDSHAAAMLHEMEHALTAGRPLQEVTARFAPTRLVGVDEGTILSAFQRALGARSLPRAQADASAEPPRTSSSAPDSHASAQRGHDDESEWRRRWSELGLRVVHDRARTPAEQMSLDEEWARQVARGARPATLRLWEWSGPAVVIGRFQSLHDEVDVDEARREGVEVVRRCTGGGAMFIEPGNTITYSLYAPARFVSGMSVERSYRLCDQWLVDALRALGLWAGFAGLNDIVSEHGKIGGAAQRRFAASAAGEGSVLHHVTLAYDIDARKMGRILRTSREKLSDKAVRSAESRVDPLRSQTGLERGWIVDHLLRTAREWGYNCSQSPELHIS
ncbi:MAG: lipoate--protein ligase family protein [Bifidobacterium sp.]|jgi:lipoate-protein ligase A